MSVPKVYQIAEFPNDKYKFDIIDNPECKKTWKEILAEEEPKGAIGIINLGYFGLSGGGYASGCKIHGEWMCKQTYTAYGICIDKDGNAFLGTGEEENAYSYSEALPYFMINGEPANTDQVWSTNGTTTLGFKNNVLVCMLCDKDNGQSTKEQIAAMTEYGCDTILRMDGSWSSHGKLGFGKVVQPSQMRCDRSYMVIYDKTLKFPYKNYKKVTLDPYGTEYLDDDVRTFDLCEEVKEALESFENIECMISRYRDNPALSPSLRADQSDQWGSDLVVSVYTNSNTQNKSTAYAWTDNSTSKANKFANKLLMAMQSIGLQTTDTIKIDSTNPILAESYACAAMTVLVGDWSTKEKREAVVAMLVEQICTQLGVPYIPIGVSPNPDPIDPPIDSGDNEETGNDTEFEDDPFNDFSNEEHKLFKDMKNAGLIPADKKMNEVVRYGDLAKILSMVSKYQPTSQDTGNDTTNADGNSSLVTINTEYLKTLMEKMIKEQTEIMYSQAKNYINSTVSSQVGNAMSSIDIGNTVAQNVKYCLEKCVTVLNSADIEPQKVDGVTEEEILHNQVG